jgi:hypothetical protein
MDKRDVTPWVKTCAISQVDSIHRKFTLTFSGWHSFSEDNRWDIFETYDPANPRAEVTIRNGIIPEDRTRLVRIAKDSVPSITAEGYEYIWLAKRRAPRETVILVPSTRNVEQDVNIALQNYDKNYSGQPIGVYRVWPGVRTMHEAVRRLMAAARIRTQIRIPDYKLTPYVVDPTLSYWAAVEQLTDPFAPVRYYVRSTNTMMIADPTATLMGSGSVLNIPAGSVAGVDVRPQRLRRIRRVLMRKTRWL